jgi:hypothetical protein
MNRRLRSPIRGALLASATLALSAACGSSSKTSSAGDASSAADRLANSLASAGAAGGMFLCAPPQSAVDACAGKTGDAACTLFQVAGGSSVEGVCRKSIDGTSLACGPKFPAPPQEIVEPCQGKAAGAACLAKDFGGQERDGQCVTAFDGKTLVCGRTFTLPSALTDPCASRKAGDTCSVQSGGTLPGFDGVCSLGPGGSGTLACTPAQALQPAVTSPCAGLAAGAACSVGAGSHSLSGKCVKPAAGGDPLCVVQCGDLAGAFPGCPGSSGGSSGSGSSGGEGSSLPAFKSPCDSLSAGAACTIGKGQWAMSGKCVQIGTSLSLMCDVSCDDASGSFQCGGLPFPGTSSSGGFPAPGTSSSGGVAP